MMQKEMIFITNLTNSAELSNLKRFTDVFSQNCLGLSYCFPLYSGVRAEVVTQNDEPKEKTDAHHASLVRKYSKLGAHK